MKLKFLFAKIFLFVILLAEANPGDTTWVTIYNNRKLTYYGNYDTATVLPTGKQYRKIRLHYILGRYACPPGTQYCGSWDYTTQVFAKPANADTVEIARIITPYATDWLQTNRKHDYVVDVTDYSPLLQGNLGIMFRYEGYSYGFTITLKLELIEGTPAIAAQSVKNIYRGYFPYGKSSEPVEQKLVPTALSYTNPGFARIKNSVSGHGADDANCAEFCSKYYQLKLNGNLADQYQIWRSDCGVNDVYPQTGTWLYDRSNWCPGAVVWPVYHNITPLTAANTPFTVDIDLQPYTAPNQNNASAGYHFESQLINYSAPSHSVDLSIEDIISPSADENHFRSNPACTNPLIRIKNNGTQTITSAVFQYGLKNAAPITYTWNGSLGFLDETTVVFPPSQAVYSVNTAGADFEVNVVSVNGTSGDGDLFNNVYSSKTMSVPLYPQKFWIITNTNKSIDPLSQKSETSWTIRDESGSVVASRSLMDINTQYTDSLNLAPGCYKFQADDSGCDGISWWVYQYYNPNPGHGLIRFNYPNSNSTFYSPNGDFGCNIIKYFRVSSSAGYMENQAVSAIEVFPVPADEQIFIRASLMQEEEFSYRIFDLSGKLVREAGLGRLQLNQKNIGTASLEPGAYLLQLSGASGQQFREKIIISR